MQLPPIHWVKRRNQKSIRIRVKSDSIIVSAPAYASTSEMKRFFNEKQDWIKASYAGLVAKQEKTESLNRFKHNELLYFGKWTPFELITGVGINDISFQKESFIIQTAMEEPDEDHITWMYANYSTSILAPSFIEVAKRLGYSFNKLTFRNQKTKWGSCSAKGNINLNWRLIKCPKLVQEYIFIHELCHLKHLNHSDKFWNLVAHHMPNYLEAEKWIKLNGAMVFQNP